MADSTTEADARIQIDDLLKQAGWDPSDKHQVKAEMSIYGVGRADYVLYDQDDRPLAIIEAKKHGIDPYTAKHQALPYAKETGTPFVFLTNGELIYFWDWKNEDAHKVESFYSRRDLARIVTLRQDQQPLATLCLPNHYVRQGETRDVRPYQQQAMAKLDAAVELGKRRFLMELPTGTGKTDVVVLYLQRLLRAGYAERVLVLVDRDQLARQMLEAVQDVLGDYSSYWLRAGMARQEKQITVCLVQTMIGRAAEYTSGSFDVVVMDECHRSIYGAWQTALTRFDAFHVGLTATPADYLGHDTFAFYECKGEPPQPDFAYPIQDAIRDGYLVPYHFATGVTQLIDEGATVDGEAYDPSEFERSWTNEVTNRLMMKELDTLSWAEYRALAPKQKVGPGKTLVFAITKHHASRLAKELNQLHPELNGRYAEVITSDVTDPDAAIKRFKKDVYPMVAVSVGMLDTGFDCREILHVVLCRPISSPILYQQIRGRGTRTAPHIDKRRFVIYDFFRNHERFNDSEAEPFVGRGGGGGGGGGGAGGEREDLPDLGLDDWWAEHVSYVEVGPDGERVDKKDYVADWTSAIQAKADSDPIVEKIKRDEPLTEAEEVSLASQLNEPDRYFNEANLRSAYQEPGGNLVDFVKAALGTVKVKTREERIDDSFRAWLVTQAVTPEQAQYLAMLKARGVATGRLAMDDLFTPPLSRLGVAGHGIALFGEARLGTLVADLDERVFRPESRRK